MTVPIGTIIAYGGSFEDNTAENLKEHLRNDGWLVCDGAEVEKDYYRELYEVIGDRFGESSHFPLFKLPDFRNRSPETSLANIDWIIKAKKILDDSKP